MRVRVFLQTNLASFRSPPGPRVVPPQTAAFDGELCEHGADGALLVRVDAWLDADGHPLTGEPRLILLPAHKVDHALVLDEKSEKH